MTRNPYKRDPGETPYTPPGGLPSVTPPSADIYAAMGEDNIFRLCEDFYSALEKTEIRPMFPEDMKEASKRLAAFLVFRLGGPPLYQQRHGQPMLRGRHMPFRIDEKSRLIWLTAFREILVVAQEKYKFPKEHLPGFLDFLEKFSFWMVNAA